MMAEGDLKQTGKIVCCNPCPAKTDVPQQQPPDGGEAPAFVETGQLKTGEPCYLPQPEDAVTVPLGNMGPIGPWATGRIDWSPMAGLTGTRPVVDKYSITRYSEGEWRQHNKSVIDTSASEQHKMSLIDWNARQCIDQTASDVDQVQENNTNKLRRREEEIHRWKCELEREIEAMTEEVTVTAEQRDRLKYATKVLMLPEAIAGDCLERRTSRLDTELVRDEIEEELLKELSLIAELREVYTRTLKDVEAQLLEDRTAKARLEFDWSDKKVAHEIDTNCIALKNTTNILMFYPGSVILPEDQSSHEYWLHFTKEVLEESRATRQRSATLRAGLDAILMNGARDLRQQADKLELALSKRISCCEEVLKRLEDELKNCLQKLADVETLLDDLRTAIRRLDAPMKKAQTRLEMRMERPRVENCRDPPCFGLVEEVKFIKEKLAALNSQLYQSTQSQQALIKARSELEREIFLKRKTLSIDRNRIQWLRSHYPTTTALSGNG